MMTNQEIEQIKRMHDRGMKPKMIAKKLEKSVQWVVIRLAAAGVVSERAKQRARARRAQRTTLNPAFQASPSLASPQQNTPKGMPNKIGDLTESVDVAYRRICGQWL